MTRFPSALLAVLSVLVVVASFVSVSVGAAEVSCGFTTQRVQCGDFGCDKDRLVCIPCRFTADCYPHGMDCNADSGKCVVRSFTSLFGFRTAISMVGAFVICSIAVIAGVGGGGILVPMFTGLIQIPMQSAVGLSQCTICGQSTLNMFLAVQKKYPDASWARPLINYQYLSLLLPLGLIGTLLGGVLSKVCPDLLRLVLLFVLLSAVLYRTVKKMRSQYAADKRAGEVTIESSTANNGNGNSNGNGNGDGNGYGSAAGPGEDAASEKTEEAERAAQPQYPEYELILFFTCFGVLLAFNVFRSYSGCGGWFYWFCIVAPLVFLSAAFYYSLLRLQNMQDTAPERITFLWSRTNTIIYPMAAVIAGAAAAMLGIGGGLVLGFVLYEVGFVPEEASVTGGMGTFFISFASVLQMLITGHLVLDFGIIFALVGTASTALGQFVFMKYIKDHGLSYLIVACLASIVGSSLLVLGGYGIFNAVDSARNGGSIMAFGRLCT